jgi:hypothetical protein
MAGFMAADCIEIGERMAETGDRFAASGERRGETGERFAASGEICQRTCDELNGESLLPAAAGRRWTAG